MTYCVGDILVRNLTPAYNDEDSFLLLEATGLNLHKIVIIATIYDDEGLKSLTRHNDDISDNIFSVYTCSRDTGLLYQSELDKYWTKI